MHAGGQVFDLPQKAGVSANGLVAGRGRLQAVVFPGGVPNTGLARARARQIDQAQRRRSALRPMFKWIEEDKIMFCSNCSKALPPGVKFCPSCGQGISHDDSAPVAPAAGKRSFMTKLRGMKTWKKVVIGIAAVIVAAVGLAMFATSDLDKPVQRHFAALHAGDMIGAYAELSVAARQQTSQDDFKAMVEGSPALAHVTGHTFSSRSLENGQGRLEGTLELDGGGKLPIEINLVKENDQWKILSYHVTSPKPAEK